MITKEQETILKSYAKIKTEIKKLEAEAEEINPQVLSIMEGQEVEEIELQDIGKLALGSRRTWIYTENTQEKEKSLKALKKEEERTGEASYEERKYVIFKTNV